jgi:hypothetical protein
MLQQNFLCLQRPGMHVMSRMLHSAVQHQLACACCVALQKIIYAFSPISVVVFGLAGAWVALG